ncbi:DUF461 family hypothetical protein [Azotobacter vinelandii CA]|uniref:Copper chaperone PCu(A)C n=4 Tax=Azotobacter group TaxID=351 RepID=C1DIK5_AZOVD|nr:DUF461 family hypothetical protein [Azotobacter vinelandii DJ]AGK16659.1 DUF461 family hypothetical protein [Azotobacter vinelandii CA]AGK20657.1 DUF461 family hypothetical protein [Azotobacter vinelandii CA6]
MMMKRIGDGYYMPTRHAKFSDLVLAESCLMFARLLSTSLLVFSCSAVLATEYRVGELQIDTPWSRALPPNAPAGAVYFTVKNGGRMADRLTGADTPNAAKTELHTHLRTGEVMRMQHIDSIEVPAGAEVKLTPGGHHIMIFKPKRPLAAGERFPLTLEFEKAGKVEIEVEVRSDAPVSAGHEHH